MRYVHLHHLCNYANTTAYAKAVYLRHEISFFLQFNVVFTLADTAKVQPPFPNRLPALTKHLSCPLQHLVDKKIKLKVFFLSSWLYLDRKYYSLPVAKPAQNFGGPNL